MIHIIQFFVLAACLGQKIASTPIDRMVTQSLPLSLETTLQACE